MSEIIKSLEAARAPQHILAAFEALQFQGSSTERLAQLDGPERQRFLNWCDDRQLSLLLPHVCSSGLPGWVEASVRQRSAHYELRFDRLKKQLFEVVDAFNAANLEFVMLKGLSHAPTLTPDARWRAQGDIDLWLTGSSVHNAQDILKSLGYLPGVKSKSRHLAPMRRPSNWQWRGDLFDPEMPVSIELHHDLWSEEAEYIAVPQLCQFWSRKQVRDFEGHRVHVLCDADLLGFACLHFLLHLLHGDLPVQRAWEIARFLDTHVKDEKFWTSWRTSHSVDLSALEMCMFCLVGKWFGCHSREEVQAGVRQLPIMAQSWLAEFALKPVRNQWAPNKSEIWLHLALIRKRNHQMHILFRRLLPRSMAAFEGRACSESFFVLRPLRRFLRQSRFLVNRLVRHALTFFPTLIHGLRWFLRDSRMPQPAGGDVQSNARFAPEDCRPNLPGPVPSEERV